MSELKEVSRFKWLLAWITNSLDPEEVLKLQETLAEMNIATRDGAFGIFDALERQNRIHDEELGFLKALITNLGRPDLLNAIHQYEEEKGTVAKILNKNSSNFGGPFFGDQTILNQVVTILDKDFDHIHAVCISGEPGIGKTRMAQEASFRMHNSHNLISVDLRGLESMQTLYFAVLHAFGVETTEYDLNHLYKFLREFDTSVPDGNTILLWDNVDSMLNTKSAAFKPFTDALRTITTIPNPRIKILMTSSYHLDMKARLKREVVNGFRLQQHNGLDSDDAFRMFDYHAGNTPIPRDFADDMSSLCGMNPMAIKVTASNLQDGTRQLQDVVANPSSQNDINMDNLQISPNNLTKCLRSSFNLLPETQKLNLIKLATFPACFSLHAARKVLKLSKRKLDRLRLELQDLKYLGLLEVKPVHRSKQFSAKVPVYSLHQSVRKIVIECAQSRPEEYLKKFKKAQMRHFKFYEEKLMKICEKVEKDTCKSLLRLRDDQANYLGFLDTLKVLKSYKSCDNMWVIVATELLLSPDQGHTLFETMADYAKGKEDRHSYADLKCYQIKHLKDLTIGKPEELLQQLNETQAILDQISEETDSKHVSLAISYCIRGELLVKTNKTTEAMLMLKKAENLQKNLSDRVHRFLVGRAVRSLEMAAKTITVAPKTFVIEVPKSQLPKQVERVIPDDESSSSCASTVEGRLPTRRKGKTIKQVSSEDESSSSCSDTVETRLPNKKKTAKSTKPEPDEDASSSSCSDTVEAKLPPRKKNLRPKQDNEDKTIKFTGRQDKHQLNIKNESSKKRTASGGSADSAVDSGSVHSSDDIKEQQSPQSHPYAY